MRAPTSIRWAFCSGRPWDSGAAGWPIPRRASCKLACRGWSPRSERWFPTCRRRWPTSAMAIGGFLFWKGRRAGVVMAPPENAAAGVLDGSVAAGLGREEGNKLSDAELVELAVQVQPPSASVTLDGRSLLGNPFRAQVPK